MKVMWTCSSSRLIARSGRARSPWHRPIVPSCERRPVPMSSRSAAHRKQTSSRAMAMTTLFAFLPRALRRTYREFRRRSASTAIPSTRSGWPPRQPTVGADTANRPGRARAVRRERARRVEAMKVRANRFTATAEVADGLFAESTTERRPRRRRRQHRADAGACIRTCRPRNTRTPLCLSQPESAFVRAMRIAFSVFSTVNSWGTSAPGTFACGYRTHHTTS